MNGIFKSIATLALSAAVVIGIATPSAAHALKEVQPLPAGIPAWVGQDSRTSQPKAEVASVSVNSVVEPYTMAWLDRYAPASVAPYSEQVGDNGQYPDFVERPAAGTYELVVDYYNQCVYAYKVSVDGSKSLERVMICSTGGNGNWTPEGKYRMGKDYHRFGYFSSYDCYGQYWSQMAGNFYFHSVLYRERDARTLSKSSYNNLGKAVSHGCIRLLVPDARWIYENCAPGTRCEVTTDIPRDKALMKVLKYGYEGATDYKS